MITRMMGMMTMTHKENSQYPLTDNKYHITSYHPVESMQGDVLEGQRQDDLVHRCGEGEHRQTGHDLRHPHTDQGMVWIR